MVMAKPSPLNQRLVALVKVNEDTFDATCEQCSAMPANKKTTIKAEQRGGSRFINYFNIRRHFERSHAKEFKQVKEAADAEAACSTRRSGHADRFVKRRAGLEDELAVKRARVQLEMSAEELRSYAIECVTVNGLPFSVFEKSGIAKMIRPIVDQMRATGQPVSLGSCAVHDMVVDGAERLRRRIRAEVDNRLVSLKFDLATRLGRSFLGVSVHVANEDITVWTLAVKEVVNGSKGSQLAAMIRDIVDDNGISSAQVFTMTVDSGANLLVAGEYLSADAVADPGLDGGSKEADIDVDDGSRDKTDTEDASVVQDDELARALAAELEDGLPQVLAGPHVIRCATHTLALAVGDAIGRSSGVSRVIGRARRVAHKLRTNNIRRDLTGKGCKTATVDVETTRWGSTFDMLQRLLAVRPDCDRMAVVQPSLRLTADEWLSVENVVSALRPIRELTIALQRRRLTPGEFYGLWLSTGSKLDKIQLPLAAALRRNFNARAQTLLDSPPILVGTFMDPRYKVLLSEDQRSRAKEELQDLHRRLAVVKSDTTDSVSPRRSHPAASTGSRPCASTTESTESGGSDNELEALLAAKERERAASGSVSSSPPELKTFLDIYDDCQRVHKDENVFRFWKGHDSAALKDLAQVALGVPVAQVSVERLFSGMKFIMSDQSANLSKESVDAIMIQRTNV